ncbi:Uncharacterised protein [Serratia quinivorans]|nr:Uncharacterised protein [Serratia quinivorans]
MIEKISGEADLLTSCFCLCIYPALAKFAANENGSRSCRFVFLPLPIRLCRVGGNHFGHFVGLTVQLQLLIRIFHQRQRVARRFGIRIFT